MYSIEFLGRDKELYRAYATDTNSLFMLCWMLSNYDGAIRYVVYADNSPILPQTFGWGNLDKWDLKLYGVLK